MVKMLIILLAAVANLILAFVILRKNKSNPVNRVLAMFAGVFTMWSLALFFYDFPYVMDSLFWIRVTYIIVQFGIIGCLYFFAYIFPTGKEMPPRWGQVAFGIAATVMAGMTIFTDTFVVGVSKQSWGYDTQLGWGQYVFNLFTCTFGFGGMGVLVGKYRKAQGYLKEQLKYMFLGLAFYIVTVLALDVIWPVVTGNSAMFSLSTVGSLFFVGFTGYAIVRHRLLDIRAAVGEIIVSVLEMMIMFGLFVSGALIYWVIAEKTVQIGALVVMGVCAFSLVFLFPLIQTMAKRFARIYFSQSVFDYQETLIKLSARLSTYLNMSELADMIISSLIQAFKVSYVGILVKEIDTDIFRLVKNFGIGGREEVELSNAHFLFRYLAQEKKIVVAEELEKISVESKSGLERDRLNTLYNEMIKCQAAVAGPIINRGRMISIIVLGKKKSGDSYTVQDINLFNSISIQAAIAIENARLYQKLNILNEGLQTRVDEATKELLIKNTDLQKANDELKTLDAMKDQLIAVTSHELRTPATNAQNYLWMTLEKPDTATILAAKDRERLQKSLNGIQNLMKLINDILDVSKIEGGKMVVNLQPTKYEHIIQAVAEEQADRLVKKDLKLDIEMEKNLPENVMADGSKLKEVFSNLIVNAIKYTDQGRIVISGAQRDGVVVFAVMDTGRGIARDNLPKLFNKFYREDSSLSSSNTETGGTGLGLYITKSLVELMRGKIWVESTVGQGSRFYFSLPIAADEAGEIPFHQKAFSGIFTREQYLKMKGRKADETEIKEEMGKRILLIEDEKETRNLYLEVLAEKYDVDTAVDGMEGWEKMKKKRYDLILLDMMMPRLDGLGVMQKIKADPDLSGSMVVLLTNLADEKAIGECFELGVKAMIMKSDVVPDKLLGVVDKLLAQAQGNLIPV